MLETQPYICFRLGLIAPGSKALPDLGFMNNHLLSKRESIPYLV